MSKEILEFKDYVIKNKTKIADEFDNEFKKLILLIKKYNPYEILYNLNFFFKAALINVKTEYDSNKNSVDLKYTLELVQMIISCIPDNEFSNNQISEIDIDEIIELGSKIHDLKLKYIWSYTYELIDSKVGYDKAKYIFESELYSDITGKRYDLFEVQHYVDLFTPLKDIFENTYNFPIEQLFTGIDNLKRKFMFGLDDAIKQMEKIMNKYNSDTIPKEVKTKFNNIRDEIFGLRSQNVGEITKWPDKFLDIFSYKNGCNTFQLYNITFEKLFDLHKEINKKPLLKLENNYYFFNIQRLLDNLDRIILKDLYRKNIKNIEMIKKITANTCEKLVGNYIKNIIPYAEVLTSNYYKSSKKVCENDVLITYGNYLFIIEVKSGSFTPDAAINNIDSHLNSLKELVENADSQVNRFMTELEKNKSMNIYESNNKKSSIKKTINLNDYEQIFKIVVTLEGFNEIEARADKIGILNLNKDIIVCSLDDLKVYSDYFEKNQTRFLHYMKFRKLTTSSSDIELHDELDHLGLYIKYNCYPIIAKKLIQSSKEEINYIDWGKAREELDLYYYGKYIGGDFAIDKPMQKTSPRLNEIIQFTNSKSNTNLLLSVCDLLDMNSKEQENLSRNFEIMIKHYANTKKIKYTFSKNSFGDLIFLVCIVDNNNYYIDSIFNNVYANMKIENSDKANILFLFYDKDKKLNEIKYFSLKSNDTRFFSDEVGIIVEEIKKNNFDEKLSIINTKKIGRNELCPCGSGLKYKRCCGK